MQRKAIVPGPTIATTNAARVVTLMDCIHDYGRRALEGIARFGNTQGGWTLELHHEDQIHQRLPPIADNVVGIIAHAFRPKLIDAIRRTGLPAVNTSSVLHRTGLPTVIPDNDAIGVTAADDLVRRGFHRLMTFVHPRWFHSVQRAAAFERTARSSGASVVTVELTSIQRAEDDIATALADSPTPLGVFAGSDGMAVFAVRQCLHLGLSMPEQVAVLGVDNDSLTTRMMSPSISSVELPWEKLGYEAAARLHRLLQGETDDDGPQLIPPTGVVTRQTTDGVSVADGAVASAIAFIRQRLTVPFTLDDLAAEVALSRRSLELRFKKATGRTLQGYLTEARIERAKQLLTETDRAMPDIAESSGFTNASYFATAFRKHASTTPTAFRARHRLG